MGMVTTGTSLITLATYSQVDSWLLIVLTPIPADHHQVHPTDTATYLLAVSLGLNALNSCHQLVWFGLVWFCNR